MWSWAPLARTQASGGVWRSHMLASQLPHNIILVCCKLEAAPFPSLPSPSFPPLSSPSLPFPPPPTLPSPTGQPPAAHACRQLSAPPPPPPLAPLRPPPYPPDVRHEAAAGRVRRRLGLPRAAVPKPLGQRRVRGKALGVGRGARAGLGRRCRGVAAPDGCGRSGGRFQAWVARMNGRQDRSGSGWRMHAAGRAGSGRP